ncbi:MAG: VOC family protein [Opitutales bacterium]|nr:VOC family protein [Opitutales bacterium]
MKKLAYIAIAVPTLEKAVPFYTQILGLPKPEIRELPNERAFEATFYLENIQLKLLAPVSNTSPLAQAVKENDGNNLLHHIAFETEDLQSQLKSIQNAGGDVIAGLGVGFVHPQTSQGVLVQFVEKK